MLISQKMCWWLVLLVRITSQVRWLRAWWAGQLCKRFSSLPARSLGWWRSSTRCTVLNTTHTSSLIVFLFPTFVSPFLLVNLTLYITETNLSYFSQFSRVPCFNGTNESLFPQNCWANGRRFNIDISRWWVKVPSKPPLNFMKLSFVGQLWIVCIYISVRYICS